MVDDCELHVQYDKNDKSEESIRSICVCSLYSIFIISNRQHRTSVDN